LLVPVIPRRENPHVYPVAFDLPSFRVSDEFYRKADLKVLQMIDEFISILESDGYHVSNKILIERFSVGGMFALRFAILHPDRVKAISAGHCGGNFTLPISNYRDETINLPVGINNLYEIAEINFDQEEYREIEQFIYIGNLDTETTTVWNRFHPTWGSKYMWESVQQMEFLHNNFGEVDPIRLENEIAYLNFIGYENIEFKLYPDLGHNVTHQMINNLMEFLYNHTKNQ